MTKKSATARAAARLRVEPIRDRDELAAICITTARDTIERDARAIERDERLQAIKEEYALEIETIEERIESSIKRMKAWASANRAEFHDRKTITVAGHTLAWRKSPGAVAYAPGVKAADVLDAVLSHPEETVAEAYTKVTATLDKNAILRAWRESQEKRDLLTSLGIEVIEPEEFTFTPDREAL
jgi:phage host-nuclease inhibitor protein Gam